MGRNQDGKASRAFTCGGGVDRAPKNWEGGFGKSTQLTHTVITNEKKLRIHFWQGLCTYCFVPLLGTPQTAGVM